MWVEQATGMSLGGLDWRLQLINTDRPEMCSSKLTTPMALLFTQPAVAGSQRRDIAWHMVSRAGRNTQATGRHLMPA